MVLFNWEHQGQFIIRNILRKVANLWIIFTHNLQLIKKEVTEFKLTNGSKAYLSAILILGDNSIISYVLGKSNNIKLVSDTLDKAIEVNPTAT